MRGIIVQRSKRAFGVIGCMVITALMFGLFHMNIIQGLYVLPMGLFWGFVGYKYNSVIPCLICLLVDQLIKIVVTANLNLNDSIVLIPNFFVSFYILFYMSKKANIC